MSFNRSKYEYFFPEKVFHCACLCAPIEKCCDNGYYFLTEIVDEMCNYNFLEQNENKIFSVKCGEKNRDCIFVCERHLAIILFAKKKYSVLIFKVRLMQPLLTPAVRRRHFVQVVSNTI